MRIAKFYTINQAFYAAPVIFEMRKAELLSG